MCAHTSLAKPFGASSIQSQIALDFATGFPYLCEMPDCFGLVSRSPEIGLAMTIVVIPYLIIPRKGSNMENIWVDLWEEGRNEQKERAGEWGEGWGWGRSEEDVRSVENLPAFSCISFCAGTAPRAG